MPSTATDRQNARANARAEKARAKALRPWFRRKRVVIPAALGTVAVIGIVAGGGDDDKATVSGQGAATSAPAAATLFPGQQEGDTVGQAGETITFHQVDATSTALFPGKPLGTEPTACTTVTLFNHGTETVQFNPYDYKLQNPGGSVVSPSFSGTGDMLTAGQLVQGGKVTGDVCFSDPLANPGDYVVLQDPLFSFDPGRLAWVNPR